jgi:hypothetical protein
MPLTTELPTEDLLFHYTTIDGLLGIFDSWKLWATDVKYLNDSKEFENESALLDLAEARALELIADDYEEIAPGSVHQTIRHVAGMAFTMRRQSRGGTYVTCFCENGDLLSQWRGYGAAGVSLGFSREALASLPPLPNPTLSIQEIESGAQWTGGSVMGEAFRPRLIKVNYGDLTSEAVEEIAQSLAGAARLRSSENVNKAVLQEMVDVLAMTAVASFKDQAFSAEVEHRLVVHGAWATFALDHFRAGPFGPVPYVEIPMDLNACLRWIVIGPPRQLNDGREQAILRLLNHHQLDNLRPIFVSSSKVPFR